ncbi:MAG: ribosome assembly cofactor RimP [Flavobacteriales bacterium]|nr:ribosome assembly cofactor RimP [Flavobacteriales bacterium]MBL6873514.1 ribosome assembly cofactor RimP [Flavobacteriales bacterium]
MQPLLLLVMLSKEKVQELIDEFISANEAVFLVSFKMSPSNQIEVLIDSIDGISVKNCIELSRHIEGNFDREEVDFSLLVSSAGLSEPFKVFKQYKKNIGKNVNVFLKEGKKLFGKMIEAEEGKGITLETTRKEKVGKKKTNIIEQHSFSFDQIDKTKIVISF